MEGEQLVRVCSWSWLWWGRDGGGTMPGGVGRMSEDAGALSEFEVIH